MRNLWTKLGARWPDTALFSTGAVETKGRATALPTLNTSPSAAGTPAGSVQFVDETTGTTLATLNLDGSGKATLITAALSVGTHHVKATYVGNANFSTSNGSNDQVVT